MKNGFTRQPKPIPHHSREKTSTSRTVSCHTNDTSKASHHQPVGRPTNPDNLEANGEMDDGLNDDDADDEDEDEDTQTTGPKQRRSRTSNGDIRPTQLRFYSGTWVDVLIAAKNNYRLFVHNDDPFPERTAASLEDAHGCLLEAIGKFREESQLSLDQGMLIQS